MCKTCILNRIYSESILMLKPKYLTTVTKWQNNSLFADRFNATVVAILNILNTGWVKKEELNKNWIQKFTLGLI